jgi:hypothetical protein
MFSRLVRPTGLDMSHQPPWFDPLVHLDTSQPVQDLPLDISNPLLIRVDVLVIAPAVEGFIHARYPHRVRQDPLMSLPICH